MTSLGAGARQLASVGLLVVAVGQLHAESPQKVADVEGISEYRLENGLQLLLFPDSTRPTITVNITYLVGSRHEGYGEAGMAHLLEHMLFKGTPAHEKIPKLLGDRGAKFNGSTWVDRTNYFETLPASNENLEFALRLEADRMINSFVRQEDLDSEMTVVRSEFEQGENSPYMVLRQRMFAVAYDWHNYGKSTIGNRSDIERVPIAKLRAFYQRFYQPDNAVLVIAGRFEPSRAVALVQQYFGAIARPPRELDRTYTVEPPRDGERTVVLRRVGEVGLVGVAYHIPAGPHPEFAAVRVLENILGSEPAGRLYQALVPTNKATSVYVSAYSWHDAGLLMALAEVRRESSLKDVERILLQETERIGDGGVTAEEVERARQQILAERELAVADTSRVAIELSEWAAQGDWRLFFLYRDRIEQVTPADVQQAAQRYLVRNNRTVGVYVPTREPERVAIPPRPDVQEMVRDYQGREVLAAGEDFDVSPENIESRTFRGRLASGIQLALLPKRTRGEEVNLALLLRYGTAENLQGLAAAADFLPQLMTRGTARLSRQQILDLLDQHWAKLSTSERPGTIIYRLKTKRNELPAVLDIVRQILREASLPENEWEIMRQEQLAILEQMLPEPSYRAQTFIDRALSPYGPDDVRYEPTLAEQIERVKNAEMSDVRRLYEDYVGGQHGQLAVVGDFEREEIQRLLEATFADWTSPTPQANLEWLCDTQRKGARETILTPDKENACYQAGLAIAMNDAHPDYPALVMANHILGGAPLASRLSNRVRQQEGLSYRVGSYFFARPVEPNATLGLYAISNPANMEKLSSIIREELGKLVSDGVLDQELEQAKTSWLEERQVTRARDDQLSVSLAVSLYAGRTMLYEAELERAVAGLSVEQVNQAVRRHIDLERLFVATAGDFAKEPPASQP